MPHQIHLVVTLGTLQSLPATNVDEAALCKTRLSFHLIDTAVFFVPAIDALSVNSRPRDAAKEFLLRHVDLEPLAASRACVKKAESHGPPPDVKSVPAAPIGADNRRGTGEYADGAAMRK